MDALALLCHLSADGTTALLRLRHAGYESIQDVLLAEDDELAQVLDVPLPRVRRIRRQAESLEDRMGEGAEVEPDAPSPALLRPHEPPPVRPGTRPNPLLCRLETEPLEGEATPEVREEPRDEAEDVAAPEAASSPTRYWMPIARDAEPDRDPGPSGPFA